MLYCMFVIDFDDEMFGIFLCLLCGGMLKYLCLSLFDVCNFEMVLYCFG